MRLVYILLHVESVQVFESANREFFKEWMLEREEERKESEGRRGGGRR